MTTDPGWPTEAEQLVPRYHPQIVVGMWSWDDRAAAAHPDAYRSELEAYLRSLLTPGNGVQLVALVQFPQIGPNDTISDPAQEEQAWRTNAARQSTWDTLAQQAVAAFPGRAVYLTTQQLFAPDQRFMTWMRDADGTWVRARKLDNTHMCPYGAAAFGALLTSELTPIVHLPAMRAGWEYGSWTHDPRYNDPPGACPNDQPPPGYSGIPVPDLSP